MKLSFSTRGWEDGSWKEWIDAAVEMDFGGVEIRDAQRMEALFERSGPFHKYNLCRHRSRNARKEPRNSLSGFVLQSGQPGLERRAEAAASAWPPSCAFPMWARMPTAARKPCARR